MPKQGQIIPEYLNPHIETYINDNTVFEEVVTPAPDGVRFVCVFTSGKGRDGVLLPFDTAPAYIDEFGKPNYKLFGQPGYMPYAALSTSMAKVWAMRVMPNDAKYANVAIVAKVKVLQAVPEVPATESTPAIPAKPIRLVVKHEAVYIPSVTDKAEFSAYVDALETTDPDVDGFVTYPLFGSYILGRGVYGNNYRLRVVSATQADKDNAYKNFRMEILESDNGLQRKEVFSGSFYPEAVDGNSTLYLGDLINDSETGSQKVGIYVCESSFSKIYDLYKSQVDTKTTLDLTTFDILTGLNKDTTVIPSIVIDSTTTGAISLDKAEGIPFTGGDDGSFAVNAADRETAINNAYISAFNGEIDRAILSKRRTPAELIMDAAYADEVKRALITLMTIRYDAFGFVDAGILKTTTDAIDWAKTMATLGDRVFSKECQNYMIKDPFTGKNIPVTTTYYLAQALPIHMKVKGTQVPFTGETNAKLTGYIKGSLKPVIDADDSDIKEQLYTNRVNYFECISENTFVRGTQGTSQTVWSDLSEENNMHVLLELKRDIETLVASKTYNFAEAEDRMNFTEVANRVISPYKGTKLKTATVEFKMSPWEEERSILHCYLAVTFRTLSKRGIIEIDINKRV